MTTGPTDRAGLWRRALLSILMVVAVLLAVLRPLDDISEGYLDSAFRQALTSFAIARGLNGVISVAQGTEIAVQPAGVGIVLSPGEILDPINDLVERFSWVMLMSSSALGAQKVLASVSAWGGIAWLFVGTAAVYLLSLWQPQSSWGAQRRFVTKLLVVLLLLRFAVPVIAILNQWTYQAFLHEQHTTSAAELEQVREDIGELNQGAAPTTTTDGDGVIEKSKQLYASAMAQLDFEKRLDRYQAAAEQVSENTIQLIVVYVLQTVVFPLLFLWGFIRLVRWMVAG